MGLSLSLLSSAWRQILKHRFFGFKNTIEAVAEVKRSLSFGKRHGDVALRTNSFKQQEESEATDTKLERLPNMGRSSSFKRWESTKPTEVSKGADGNSGPDRKVPTLALRGKTATLKQITKPRISLPEPAVFFSPRPVTELDAAATKLQKVYKSYRTRRNLADCAVVVEELWWRTLDSAALKLCSISFFDTEKHETAVSRWSRIRRKAAKVGKGLSKDENAQKLALQHWLEAIDPRHRYGHNLHFYYDVWSASKSSQPFFYWLDVGDGREVNLEKCPRTSLQRQCIKYLGPKERESFEVIIDSGKLMYRESGKFLNTSEDSKWIFVLSTSRALYVGQKKKGMFQHSSFLSGGATTAAGRLVAYDGILKAIWPYSGHYLPTENNFKEFISFLEEHNVDMTNVKRCSIDEDYNSFRADSEDMELSKPAELKEAPFRTQPQEASQRKVSGQPLVFDLTKRLSCKWTSGLGPRIGCVRDYPVELQSQALEKVKLSPRPGSRPGRYGPIPSPRPSPKIKVSPRLSYMGLPSPRVTVNGAC